MHESVRVLILCDACQDEETQLDVVDTGLCLCVLHHYRTVLEECDKQVRRLRHYINDWRNGKVWSGRGRVKRVAGRRRRTRVGLSVSEDCNEVSIEVHRLVQRHQDRIVGSNLLYSHDSFL